MLQMRMITYISSVLLYVKFLHTILSLVFVYWVIIDVLSYNIFCDQLASVRPQLRAHDRGALQSTPLYAPYLRRLHIVAKASAPQLHT